MSNENRKKDIANNASGLGNSLELVEYSLKRTKSMSLLSEVLA